MLPRKCVIDEKAFYKCVTQLIYILVYGIYLEIVMHRVTALQYFKETSFLILEY